LSQGIYIELTRMGQKGVWLGGWVTVGTFAYAIHCNPPQGGVGDETVLWGSVCMIRSSDQDLIGGGIEHFELN